MFDNDNSRTTFDVLGFLYERSKALPVQLTYSKKVELILEIKKLGIW